MRSKAKLQVIPLLPTKFKVDVFICNDLEVLAKVFYKRYGIVAKDYWDNQGLNQVMIINSGDASELKGEKRIVMNISELNPSVVTHEVNHVFYDLCKCIHATPRYDAQEWHSYYLEYLFELVMNKKNYKNI